ncbi:TPA: hypothetical protein EYP13_03790, partial [Candidatus Micrarchaeota archaeon]|nr:hypothetical protein [Candidatus Micrarchaeota archaeon]
KGVEGSGTEYVVISINGKTHANDPAVLQYFKEVGSRKMFGDAVKGTCMVCGKQGEVTGSALRLANLKFATPDKEVFVPIGTNKEKAFSIQFPLCEDDAKIVMVGAAFAASESQGKLRDRIASIGGVTFEYIVLPMPKMGKRKTWSKKRRTANRGTWLRWRMLTS